MLVTLGALPCTAHAGTVQCGNEDDSCEVSNEPFDFVSCACIGEGTGGEEWADFSESELVEVCESYLMHCNGEGTGDDGTDDGGDGSTEAGCSDADGEGTGDGGEVDGGEVDGGEVDGGEVDGGEDDGGEDSGGEGTGDGGEGSEDGAEEPCWGCSVGEGSDIGGAASLVLLGLFGLRRRTRV